MFWTCERCHHLNLGLPNDESTSLLHEDQTVFTCEACGHRSLEPDLVSDLFTPSRSLLGVAAEAIADFPLELHRASDDNCVEILDTPNMWSVSFDKVKSKSEIAKESVARLVGAMAEIIAKGRQVIDIVSLSAPVDDDFEKAILDGIETAGKATEGAVVIRILIGYTPTRDYYAVWAERLLLKLKDRFIGKKYAPRLFYGQLATTTSAASVLVGEEYWNHAKIIAADGVAAVVGGHNFAQEAYQTYPMTHDISVRIVGPAAAHAQSFCDYLWNHNTLKASTNLRLVLAEEGKSSSMRWEKFDPKVVQFGCYTELKTYSFSTITRPTRVDPQKAPKLWSSDIPAVHPFEPRGKSARVLTLGRGIAGHRASDAAKLALIKGARKSIRLCQQDLVFTGKFAFAEKDHVICEALANALVLNQQLVVQVVISPPGGWAGGDPYSWGQGAKGTWALLAKFILARVSTDSAASIFKRLHVAPFCFTACDFGDESEYVWPNCGKIATPFPVGSKCIPMPGNHAKVFFVDDSICYVGSDNLYPNYNVEFGYLIEGAAVQSLLEDYWSKVWWHSRPHCYKP